MKNIELLAPAGSKESLISAINNGANAVYLGMKNFNARNKAENFDETNIRDYVKLAHLYGVKVYLTVNTLLKNSEVNSFISTIKSAVMAKVDAFIIQDLGVAKILKDCFPNIVMHASTQMGIHNLEGAKLAKKLGFKRVILSREATLQDIKNIKNNCNIEIEYFVQGALCVAFSGNCYFSSLNFGESGNRGRCLQPCRLSYVASLEGKPINSGYLISPNDLCLIGRIKELSEAGVVSFKIEGRMRRPSYVAQTVLSYRKAIDKLGNINLKEEMLKLEKVFSRGKFNDGYYLDNNISKNIINPMFQNHRGIKIGKVLNCTKFKDLNKITIKTSGYNIVAGDGLKFVSDGFESSMGVGNVNKISESTVEVFSKNKAQTGCDVYLTLDANNETKLLNATKFLPISVSFVANINEYARLTLCYNNIKVVVTSENKCEQAKSSPITNEQVYECVCRLGDTHFELKNFECELNNVFLAKSQINKMRREASQKLEEEIIKHFEDLSPKISFSENDLQTKFEYDFENNTYYVVDEFHTYNVPKQACVVLAPTVFNKNVILKLKQTYSNNKIFVMLPLIKRNEDNEVVTQVLLALNKKTDGLVANNIYGLQYLMEGFKVVANYNLNITNNYSAMVLSELGVCDFVKSIERDLTVGLNCGIEYGGYPTLMTYTHCPYKTAYGYSDCNSCKFKAGLELTNERGHTFKIRRVKVANCYFELVNDIKQESANAKMIDLRGSI